MLYMLLFPLHTHYVGFNVLRYETFRSVLAGLAALALSLALGPLLIQRFRAAHIGQTIRDEVPQSHQKKAGTPTMGGLLILAPRSSPRSCSPIPRNPYVWIAIFVTLAFGAIGFTDDLLKLRRGKGQGLSGPQKLFWQFACAFVAAFVLFVVLRFDTTLTVPFLKNLHPSLPRWLYVPFAMFVIVGVFQRGQPDRRPRRSGDRPGDDGGVLLLDVHLRRRQSEIRDLPRHPARRGRGRTCDLLRRADRRVARLPVVQRLPGLDDDGRRRRARRWAARSALSRCSCKQELVLPIAGGIFVIEAGVGYSSSATTTR